MAEDYTEEMSVDDMLEAERAGKTDMAAGDDPDEKTAELNSEMHEEEIR